MASILQPSRARPTTDRRMFSSSDDIAMMKQIQTTHAPDGREIEVQPILVIIEEILHRAAPGIDGIINVRICINLLPISTRPNLINLHLISIYMCYKLCCGYRM